MNHATKVALAIADQRELGTPEQRLADLVSRRLGTLVSSARMRSLVLASWDELTVLAHAIHEKSRRAQARAIRREASP